MLGIFLGVVLFLLNYFSEHLYIKDPRQRSDARSFASGLGMAYLFLELMPSAMVEENSYTFFFFILAGFSIFHLFEKYIYQHAEGRKLRQELNEEHTILFTLYHIIAGIGIVLFLQENIYEGILFFIPIALHDLLSSASLRHAYVPWLKKKPIKIIISGSVLIGCIFGSFLTVGLYVFQGLIGFIAGGLLHVMVRDFIPPANKGNPTYFLLGVMAMILFLFAKFFA